jgi:cupin fold WbuC family metalloprotein
MTPLAFPNPTSQVFLSNPADWQRALEASRVSPRRRFMLPIHRHQSDVVQRMLNVLQPDTYIPPHQHPSPGFTETICVLQGAIGFFAFDQAGVITQQQVMRAGEPTAVCDFAGDLWHSFICLAPDTVVMEIKLGPYNAAMDKRFPSWAPAEGDPAAGSYLQQLVARLD